MDNNKDEIILDLEEAKEESEDEDLQSVNSKEPAKNELSAIQHIIMQSQLMEEFEKKGCEVKAGMTKSTFISHSIRLF